MSEYGKYMAYDPLPIDPTRPVVEKTEWTWSEGRTVIIDGIYLGSAREEAKAGYWGAENGDGILTNPYKQDSTEFRWWVDGWCEFFRLNKP